MTAPSDPALPRTGSRLAAVCLLALLAAPALGNLLYSIEPSDPVTYTGIIAVLLVVAAAASYLPARRATRIDAATVLKN